MDNKNYDIIKKLLINLIDKNTDNCELIKIVNEFENFSLNDQIVEKIIDNNDLENNLEEKNNLSETNNINLINLSESTILSDSTNSSDTVTAKSLKSNELNNNINSDNIIEFLKSSDENEISLKNKYLSIYNNDSDIDSSIISESSVLINSFNSTNTKKSDLSSNNESKLLTNKITIKIDPKTKLKIDVNINDEINIFIF